MKTRRLTHAVCRLCLATALASTAIAAAPASAQREGTDRNTRVQFQRGSTAATYHGTVRGLAMHSYRFSARKWQVLNATLSSPSPDVDALVYFIGRDGVAVSPVDDPLELAHQTLPYTGRYEIRVLQTRNGARKGNASHPYTLTIAIHAASATGAQAPRAAEVGTTPELRRAAWTDYRCHNGQRVKVRYHYGEATARAQGQWGGRATTLMYAPDSHADITVFEGSGLRWSINNLPPGRKLRAEGAILSRPTTQVINGQDTAVDEILRKGCEPVR